jgi:hypothetical protein
MKLKVISGIIMVAVSATALQAMTSETFYQKSVALQKKGMAAMFSSDVKVITTEFQAAAKAVKAENEAAKAAGKPIYCPPAKPQKMSAEQLIAEFGKIPQSRRQQLSVRQAWREIAIRKYPC